MILSGNKYTDCKCVCNEKKKQRRSNTLGVGGSDRFIGCSVKYNLGQGARRECPWCGGRGRGVIRRGVGWVGAPL